MKIDDEMLALRDDLVKMVTRHHPHMAMGAATLFIVDLMILSVEKSNHEEFLRRFNRNIREILNRSGPLIDHVEAMRRKQADEGHAQD